MEILDLTRISTDPDVGTFGVLKWRDHAAPFALSLEDPDKDNERNVSCIPDGIYQCVPFKSPTHGPTFMVREVPNRTFILFHRGNTHINTQGCILIGESYHFLNDIPSIASSAKGFAEFWQRAHSLPEFQLDIRWA